jgi:hypothetical protein
MNRGGSGCCDCGDIEAWSAGGSCPHHRPRPDSIIDPSADLDTIVKSHLSAVVRGVLSVVDGFLVGTTRGRASPLSKNEYIIRRDPSPMTCRLHNGNAVTAYNSLWLFKFVLRYR